jgi:adenylate cyclase
MSLKRRLAAVIFAFIGLAVAAYINSIGAADYTELFFKRTVFHIRGKVKPDPRIFIAGIDDNSISLLQEAGVMYPFPRTLHADLIRKLADAGAKVAVFDILFSTEPFDPAEDEAMRDAINYARNKGMTVVLSCALARSEFASGLAAEQQSLEKPTDVIMEAQPLLAVVNTGQKLSYKEKEFAIIESLSGETLYSQAAQAYRVLSTGGSKTMDDNPSSLGISGNGDFIVNYIGPDGSVPSDQFVLFFPELVSKSFGGGTQAMDMSKFKDAAVFVGSRAKADNDYFMTPFGEMYGVETNTQALNTLLTGGAIRTVNTDFIAAFVLLLALLAWLFTAFLRPVPSFIAFTVVLVAYEAAIVWAFVFHNFQMPFTYPSATLFFAFFFSLSFRVLTEEAEKRRIRATFSRYMAPDIVKEIIDNPDLADLGGNDREVALLFSDIRNYSTISEKLDPHQTVEFLNRYLTEVSDIIMRNGGFVDKFMGDGVMSIFGAPVKRENPCADAVRSALEMVELLVDRMDGIVSGLPVPHFRVGIGIHYGHVIMGNVGSARRMDYTCIGDVVNVASRLETETKHFGTAILISDDVQEKIGDEFILELLGETMVKGRTAPVKVYKVLHERGLEMTDITQFLPGGSMFPQRDGEAKPAQDAAPVQP